MNESTKTKKALRGSLFALFLCIALLIGTTFAWFTDTASTGVNKIQSGKLKMKVEYSKDMVTWTEVSADKSVFDENALWEPGRTAVVYFRVSNIGNLAFRYDFDVTHSAEGPGFNSSGEEFYLHDYLMFGSAETDVAYTNREGAISAVSANERVLGSTDFSVAKQTVLMPEETKTVALVLYMPGTVGNEANNVDEDYNPMVELGVKVNATQATVESDSFGTDYDAKAPTIFSYVDYFDGTHTLTESVSAAGGKWRGAVTAYSGSTVTIAADVEGKARNNYAMAVYAQGGKIIINNGNFTQEKPGNDSAYTLIYADNGGKIEINGGTFKGVTPQWTLNCLDNSGATITVKGGKFYKFDPSNANVGANEVIVPSGYKVVQDGDWFKVVTE